MNTVIDVQNITVGYGEKIILKDISFKVNKGEMIGIVGPNGAGKSTLMKTLRGLLPYKEGTINIFANNINNIKERDFAHFVAYLQQSVDVSFGYTGKELVLAGRYPYLKWWQGEGLEDEIIAKQCMEYTGVWDLADCPVQEISGGQRQRVLLAKVLAQKTPVLFLDEPTTGLDIVYQEEIFRFCNTLCGAGKTVIMVAHELNLAAKFCDRLILIAKNKILAEGLPKEVISSENLTKAYGVPVEVNVNPMSGSMDIAIIPSEEEQVKKEQLVKAICDL